MELVSTYICKAFDIGVAKNMFGGAMMAMIDDCAASYASQICDSPNLLTLKVDELVFKKPTKIGNILKTYARVEKFGKTSISIYLEVRKHNVYTGDQEVVTHTNIKFVRVDDEGNPIPISERVQLRYWERIKTFNRGLLTQEEREIEKNNKKQ